MASQNAAMAAAETPGISRGGMNRSFHDSLCRSRLMCSLAVVSFKEGKFCTGRYCEAQPGLALDQEPWLQARNRRMMVHAREAVIHVTPTDGHPGVTPFFVGRLQEQRQFVGRVGEE